MRLVIVIFLAINIVTFTYGQKPPLDTNTFNGWPKAEWGKISSDGKYVSYEVNVSTILEHKVQAKTIIRSVQGNWEKVFHGNVNTAFSSDAKTFFILLPSDTLMILSNGTDKVAYIQNVGSYSIKDRWLLYTKKGEEGALFISQHPYTVSKKVTCTEYLYDEKANALLLKQQDKSGNTKLIWHPLTKGNEIEVFNGSQLSLWSFNQRYRLLVFTVDDNERSSIWLYRAGEMKSKILTETNERVSNFRDFSENGKRIFFVTAVQEKKSIPALKNIYGSDVLIYSWRDIRLKNQRKAEVPEDVYALNIDDHKLVKITGKNQSVVGLTNDYAIIRETSGTGTCEERAWNPASKTIKQELVSLIDGSRKEQEIKEFYFSRGGKYLLYFDESTHDYYTRELLSGATKNITRLASPGADHAKEFDLSFLHNSYWMDRDSALILVANYDIWKIDPTGTRPPINITNGYGRTHGINFAPVNPMSDAQLSGKAGILLCARNKSNRDNGLYYMYPRKHADPEKLVMGAHYYTFPYDVPENGFDSRIMKAENADVWLVRRMKEDEAPNFFVTKDFKIFQPVSDVYPERTYNWYTTELYTFKSLDGEDFQGILYKPQDFDPNKKYPIIFHYYMEFARNLHAYLDPGYAIGPINVPWMVSRGYLVFIPDIRHKPGKTGESAYSVVEGAANYISKLPFVNATKMGLQGHSFGGYQTDFIVTRSKLFAAACASSGVGNLISFGGELDGYGKPNYHMANEGQLGMNATLWQDRDRYIRNSPVFELDKVTTPLLMMATTKDNAVPYAQGLELFNALRLLQKKAWLLTYPDENHILTKPANYRDFTDRMTEFFDHYLMDKPMPDWMESFNGN